MFLRKIFEQFVGASPVTVMFRAAMENVFAPVRLDKLFSDAAKQQYEGRLLFSTVANLLAGVVCRYHKSVLASYRADKEIGVSVRAVYESWVVLSRASRSNWSTKRRRALPKSSSR